MDVQAWKNKQDLERALVSLVEQPGALFAVSDSEGLVFFSPAILMIGKDTFFFRWVGSKMLCRYDSIGLGFFRHISNMPMASFKDFVWV